MGWAEGPCVTTVLWGSLRGEPDPGGPAGDTGRPQYTILPQLLLAQHPLLLASDGEPWTLPTHPKDPQGPLLGGLHCPASAEAPTGWAWVQIPPGRVAGVANVWLCWPQQCLFAEWLTNFSPSQHSVGRPPSPFVILESGVTRPTAQPTGHLVTSPSVTGALSRLWLGPLV